MQQLSRLQEAEAAVYQHACDRLSSQRLKAILGDLGFETDLRSGWIDNALEVLDVESGELLTLEC